LNHLHFGCVYVNVVGEGFRCSFRVGIEVLLAARLEQRPQVGCAALLSAGVTAYKTSSLRGPDESPAFRISGIRIDCRAKNV
jgi:hypothetical protein